MNKKQTENPEFETKNLQFKVDETGKVSARIATFGVIDQDYDIVEATAFKAGQEVAIVWSHDWDRPVGKGVIHVTPTEAIFEGMFFLDVVNGMEAYKTVRAMGDLQEWSWGFHAIKSSREARGDRIIRHIEETELFEVSPVLKGAGIGTRTLALKGRNSLESQIKSVLESVDSLRERVRSLKGLRQEDGREISDERRTELRSLAIELRKTAEELETVSEILPVIDAQKEFNRYQLFLARQNGVEKEN